jgi:hypothetical protein
LILQNTGSFNITLKNNSGSSTSGNRFLLSDDFTMSSNDFIFAQYDTISDGWRIAELPRQYVDSLSMNGGTLRISLFNDKTAHKELNMTENIQDIVGNMIGAQTNIAVTYNDATGKISYVASGGGYGRRGWDERQTLDPVVITSSAKRTSVLSLDLYSSRHSANIRPPRGTPITRPNLGKRFDAMYARHFQSPRVSLSQSIL